MRYLLLNGISFYVCIVHHKKFKHLLFSGGKDDEMLFPVLMIPAGKIPVLLKLLPDPARKMGNLPIRFRQDIPVITSK